MRVILATTNPAKVRALAWYLHDQIRFETLPGDIRLQAATIDLESGKTCSEIACAKAMYWSKHLPDRFVLATDGGLVIRALGGQWDPARTARFDPDAVDNTARARSLLALTAHLTGGQREIFWVESLAIARNGSLVNHWAAAGPPGYQAETLPDQPITDGFWVPTIWLCPEVGNRRLADLTDVQQHARNDHWQQLADFVGKWSSAEST